MYEPPPLRRPPNKSPRDHVIPHAYLIIATLIYALLMYVIDPEPSFLFAFFPILIAWLRILYVFLRRDEPPPPTDLSPNIARQHAILLVVLLIFLLIGLLSVIVYTLYLMSSL